MDSSLPKTAKQHVLELQLFNPGGVNLQLLFHTVTHIRLSQSWKLMRE